MNAVSKHAVHVRVSSALNGNVSTAVGLEVDEWLNKGQFPPNSVLAAISAPFLKAAPAADRFSADVHPYNVTHTTNP